MNVRRIALIAVCIAIVTVLVASVQVPSPATGGFAHPGSIAEVFISLAFGPIIGAIAAGVGAAIADLSLGYGSFAPMTLVAHGLLGYLVGLIGWKKPIGLQVAAWIIGGLALVAVYFIGGATLYGFGYAGAVAELPLNLTQSGLGILGLLLYKLVKSAYPQLESLAGDEGFSER